MADWGMIDKVRERVILDEKGELVKVFHIEATTVKGISFSMDIPADEIDAPVVNETLRKRAQELDALLEL